MVVVRRVVVGRRVVVRVVVVRVVVGRVVLRRVVVVRRGVGSPSQRPLEVQRTVRRSSTRRRVVVVVREEEGRLVVVRRVVVVREEGRLELLLRRVVVVRELFLALLRLLTLASFLDFCLWVRLPLFLELESVSKGPASASLSALIWAAGTASMSTMPNTIALFICSFMSILLGFPGDLFGPRCLSTVFSCIGIAVSSYKPRFFCVHPL